MIVVPHPRNTRVRDHDHRTPVGRSPAAPIRGHQRREPPGSKERPARPGPRRPPDAAAPAGTRAARPAGLPRWPAPPGATTTDTPEPETAPYLRAPPRPRHTDSTAARTGHRHMLAATSRPPPPGTTRQNRPQKKHRRPPPPRPRAAPSAEWHETGAPPAGEAGSTAKKRRPGGQAPGDGATTHTVDMAGKPTRVTHPADMTGAEAESRPSYDPPATSGPPARRPLVARRSAQSCKGPHGRPPGWTPPIKEPAGQACVIPTGCAGWRRWRSVRLH